MAWPAGRYADIDCDANGPSGTGADAGMLPTLETVRGWPPADGWSDARWSRVRDTSAETGRSAIHHDSAAIATLRARVSR